MPDSAIYARYYKADKEKLKRYLGLKLDKVKKGKGNTLESILSGPNLDEIKAMHAILRILYNDRSLDKFVKDLTKH